MFQAPRARKRCEGYIIRPPPGHEYARGVACFGPRGPGNNVGDTFFAFWGTEAQEGLHVSGSGDPKTLYGGLFSSPGA